MTTQALSIGCRDIRHSYKTGFTLEVPEVSVSAGSTLALLGPSGAGKSTLLSVLGLLEQPRAGEVRLGDRVVGVRDRDARLQMAAVFQRAFLF
ncbi:MAG: ATP-binding cassette domain-containing protein, partial [Coriobacteriia bacterium]|nr:ATP-binding cassette domain-containing protein [Coriobacteriia bacterium]